MSRRKVENILVLEHIWPWNVAMEVFFLHWEKPGDDEKRSVLSRVYTPGLLEAMETLTEREQDVLTYRYRDGLTLEETGEKYHVTRERIRQIEAKALRKLRHPMRQEMIKGVSYGDWKSLREDYWELKARYERVHAEALEACLANMCDAKAQLDAIKATEAEDVRKMSIQDLDLSVRSFNCLLRADIKTVGDIVALPVERLKKVRNLGRRSVEEIVDKVNELGLVIRYADGTEYKAVGR